MDKEGNSALMAAASTAGDRSKTKATSKLGVLEFLLDEGADVEMASHKGYTSLVWAARYVRIAYCIAMHYSVRPIAVRLRGMYCILHCNALQCASYCSHGLLWDF